MESACWLFVGQESPDVWPPPHALRPWARTSLKVAATALEGGACRRSAPWSKIDRYSFPQALFIASNQFVQETERPLDGEGSVSLQPPKSVTESVRQEV
jgi:hypothetical protein